MTPAQSLENRLRQLSSLLPLQIQLFALLKNRRLE